MVWVKAVLEPQDKDLGGGFMVRRLLPQRACRAIGPFVFWDHFGPALVAPGRGGDVRPHPHIGLATVTYLFEGATSHRDSLGVHARVVPGDINLMTAGRGIVHSERTPSDLRGRSHTMHGIQAWLALPIAHEEDEPAFDHVGASDLPVVDEDGVRVTVLAGSLLGVTSPTPVRHPTIYADVRLDAGTRFEVPADYAERGVYVVSGAVEVDGETYGAHRLLVLTPGELARLRASEAAHVMLLGGEPLDGPRHMHWNFVSSRRERIEEARNAWRASAAAGFRDTVFSLPEGETEHIPLPGE